jgi:hypothetical protein
MKITKRFQDADNSRDSKRTLMDNTALMLWHYSRYGEEASALILEVRTVASIV